MGIVGTDEVHLMSLHALKARPDVGLDVLHDVADVERAVGVRQRRRNEQRPGGRGRYFQKKPCENQGETANSSKATSHVAAPRRRSDRIVGI